MKVFFSVSPKAKHQFGKIYKSLHDEIEALGYQHVSDEAIEEDHDSFYTEMEQGSKEKYEDLYKEKLKCIQIADINIFDVTASGVGLGFNIDKSLELNKPTIVFYHEKNVPYFLSGIDDEKLILKAYSDKNYKKILREALEQARERRDKRFNFFISPKLLDYLERTSNSEGITKSKFIRNLIVQKMRDQNKSGDNI